MSSPSAIPLAEGPRPDPSLGVFETLLVRGGRPLELEPHLARIAAGLRDLYEAPLPAGARELLLERTEGEELARARLTIAPDGALDVVVARVDPGAVLPGAERAVDLAPVVVAGGIGAHKWADRRLLGRLEESAAPRLPLLLDRDHTVLEASRGNLFLIREGGVFTPPADGRILPGVTRQRILRLADALGIPVAEEPIPLERLADSDELFVTGAVRGIEPVRTCGGVNFAPDGRITAALAEALRERWAGDLDLAHGGGLVHAKLD